MLLQNINVSLGWVNGRIAFIHELCSDHIVIRAADNPLLLLRLDRIERTIPFTSYSRLQFPLTLAWAFTVHKVQSLTLSKVAIDIRNMFAQGQLYVALSRVRNLQDIYIINWNAARPLRTFKYNRSINKYLLELSNVINTSPL